MGSDNQIILNKNPQASEDLDLLLKELVKGKGSDLHLKAGEPPIHRIHGKLKRTNKKALTEKDTEFLIKNILGEEKLGMLDRLKELDTGYSVSGVARFRVSVFYDREKLSAVFRMIPFQVQTIDELGLPSATKDFCRLPRGLILVTGPTGAGKSTTLAAMIDWVNHNRRCHIITIEDPVEFLHNDKLSVVNQREVGEDTHSFSSALSRVLRQSPDVIMVGELRDLETISLAITAAETGSLVFATLHTTDAAQTVDRMVDVFPAEQQEQIRLQLSMTLEGVISQTLVPRIDKSGRIAAFEVLVCHSGVKNIVREGRTHQIYALIQSGSQHGMELLDRNLMDLVDRNIVVYEEALARASNPSDFDKLRGLSLRNG